MAEYTKIADVVVKDGTYEKDGKERNRYQNVGCIFSTPHGSHMFVKLNATATSEGRILNIFPNEGVVLKVEQQIEGDNEVHEQPDF